MRVLVRDSLKMAVVLVVALVLTMATPRAMSNVTYSGKLVSAIQSYYDGADSFYFKLQGVAVADPVIAGNPWFAISRSQYGAKDGLATMMAAKLSGATVLVETRGTIVCGFVGVAQLILE